MFSRYRADTSCEGKIDRHTYKQNNIHVYPMYCVCRGIHQDNMSVKCVYTHLNRTFMKKNGFSGVSLIFVFCSNTYNLGTRWNRLAEAFQTCTHNLCFEHS